MAFPSATLVYKVPVRGAGTVAQVQEAVESAVPPFAELSALGVRITSDVTTAADPVVRTMHLTMEPDSVATATSALTPDGSSIASVTVTAPGSGYVVPPVPFFEAPGTIHAQGQAYLKMVSIALAAGGSGFSAGSTLNFIGGLAPGSARQDKTGRITQRTKDPIVGPNAVSAVAIANPGRRYTSASVVQFLGSCTRPARGIPVVDSQGRVVFINMVDMGAGYIQAPDVVISGGDGKAKLGACMQRGRAATANLTIVAGVVTGIAITDEGDGYVQLPQVVFFDPTGGGGGAVAVPSFGVSRVDVLQPGYGYTNPSGIVMFSRYESIFALALENGSGPALASTILPFVNLMTQAIQSVVASPVSVSLPT